MSIDFFASARSTALITLVAASFTSPIIVKSDAWSAAGDRLAAITQRAEAPATEQVIAGGVAFEKPADWGVLGSSAVRASDDGAAADTDRIGAVVSGLCPGGSAGSDCADGVQVTFVAYAGGEDKSLPALNSFRRQLDMQLAKEFRGFKPADVQVRAGADGSRYLDYAFTYRVKGEQRTQRIAAFRHADGRGVVALTTGAKLPQHDAALDRFFASSHELDTAA